MKLHLPKRLLTALLATFTVVTSLSSTAWGGWGKGYDAYTDGFVYYLNGDSDISTVEDVDSFTLSQSSKFYVQAGDINSGTVEQMTVKSGDEIVFSQNTWQNATHQNLSGLIINSLSIGNEGSASVVVNADQGVLINNVNGSITGEINGTLTFEGTEENELNIAYSGVDAFTGSGVLVIGDHATVTVDRGDGGNSAAAIQSNIKILGGGTMNVTKMDAMGWGPTERMLL